MTIRTINLSKFKNSQYNSISTSCSRLASMNVWKDYMKCEMYTLIRIMKNDHQLILPLKILQTAMKKSCLDLDQNLLRILKVNHSKRNLMHPSINHSPSSKYAAKPLAETTQYICNQPPLQQTLTQLRNKKESKCKNKLHEGAKTQFLCISPQCEEQNRIGCSSCIVENHNDHQRLDIHTFLKLFTENHLKHLHNFQSFILALKFVKDSHESQLQEQLQDIKKVFLETFEACKDQLVTDMKCSLNSRLRDQYKTLIKSNKTFLLLNQLGNQNSFDTKLKIILSMKQQQNNNQLIQGIEHMKNYRYNPYISFFNDLRSSIKSIFQFKQNSGQLHQIFKFQQMNQIREASLNHLNALKIEQGPAQVTFTQKFIDKLGSQVLKKCQENHRYYVNPENLDNHQLTRNLSLKNLDYVNTLSLFKCCNNLYCCTKCHNNYATHNATQTVPSIRVCSHCKKQLEVPFNNSIPVNCKTCVKKSKSSNQ